MIDLTWNNGESYLYRDHRDQALAASIDIHTLFALSQNNNLGRIKIDYASALMALCGCEGIELRKLSGSIYEHIILKKELANISSQYL